jgi:aldose 1-epimerase
MAKVEVASCEWEKIPALELRAGDYRALALPGYGGHLLSLEDSKTAYLRKPRDLAQYLILPEAYGIPVLFPPNRIAGARFTAGGLEYHLPANNGDTHLHGFLFKRPWQVDHIGASGGAAEITLSFTAPRGAELFRWFPHPFSARLTYRLEEGRLFQEISFENQGDTPMPFMLGFHTSFALPDRGEDAEAYRITIGLGDTLNGENRAPIQEPMAAFRNGRVLRKGEPVFGQFLAEPFTAPGEKPCHGALIENLRTGGTLRYVSDDQFAYWVIWNQNGNDTFLSIEPQTCAINAANMHREQDLFGFRMLEAGAVFSAENSIMIT